MKFEFYPKKNHWVLRVDEASLNMAEYAFFGDADIYGRDVIKKVLYGYWLFAKY